MEFAFVLPVMILLLWGIVSFGAIFTAQMSLSSAVTEGARALVRGADRNGAETIVAQSLAAAGLVADHSAAMPWIQPDAGDCRIRVVAPIGELRGTPVLGPLRLPMVRDVNWLPTELRASASGDC